MSLTFHHGTKTVDGVLECLDDFRKQGGGALLLGQHYPLGMAPKEYLQSLVKPRLEGDEGAALHGARCLGLGKGRLGRFHFLLQPLQAVVLRGLLLGCLLQLGVAIDDGSLLGLQLLLLCHAQDATLS